MDGSGIYSGFYLDIPYCQEAARQRLLERRTDVLVLLPDGTKREFTWEEFIERLTK